LVCVVGPWIVATVLGLLGSTQSKSLVIAAPSPIYPLVIAREAIERGAPFSSPELVAPMVAALAYLVGGFVLGHVAKLRSTKAIEDHRALLADADRRLAEEDAQAREARASRVDVSPSATATVDLEEPRVERTGAEEPHVERTGTEEPHVESGGAQDP
jgi:hypothetical protein